jgi:hypothetical protein
VALVPRCVVDEELNAVSSGDIHGERDGTLVDRVATGQGRTWWIMTTGTASSCGMGASAHLRIG